MNVARLTARNRSQWKEARQIVLRVCERSKATPREVSEITEVFDGGDALAHVCDIRDALGRPSSIERVQPLLDEYSAWVSRLPETAA